MLVQNKKFVFIILGILFIFNILAGLTVYELSKTKFLEVNFFAVGQGDAIFIETPNRQQILIDGGPSPIILEKLGKEMPFWDRTIDLIVLTHPEKDHVAGLLDVLKRYQIENILWTGIARDTAEFKEWKRLIKKEQKDGASIKISQANQKISLLKSDFNGPGWQMDVLYPLENLEGKTYENSNDTSIVNKLSFGDISFLFTGDIPKSTEQELLDLVKQRLDADVLKISHHGSKNSSDENFIKEVSPMVAVISAGLNNQYGHPATATLETLKKYGIDILRTDINGDIKIISDGKTYAVSFIQN